MMKTLKAAAVGLFALGGCAAAPQPDAELLELRAHAAELREIVAGPAAQARPEVLIVGTFHFANPGLDAHQSKYTFNVFSERGQKELNELLDRLAEFKPTKILVERSPEFQNDIDTWFNSYKEGKQENISNEIVTVGFALAKRLGHEKVYGFDARPEWLSTMPETPEQFTAIAKRIGREFAIDDPMDKKYSAMHKRSDDIEQTMTLRQQIRFMNMPEVLKTSHGAYFYFSAFRAADGKEFPGPDGFASAWHNRNLRMYSNIQRLADDPDDRVLVLVGAGHVPILQMCAQSDPGVRWVELDGFLKP